ncbi:hypothetical protein HETIRDRAFT_120102 [Heterobasidion irregulare TC 32-1]|uniref:Uncharacterized protein n=1 Tax=Heterobasidion irregulare (strain TC 32-1) TaxID=747525 RepID=W4JXF4_HETIT|nr:uncharacterized protein HETIRDRAFT_120102 [Heterobasidion irregulare TC 32-1]ETW78228.1 hypothetical protein HETIRDRAFT_120102 [Heterobasidion irregulare TC 32-1]
MVQMDAVFAPVEAAAAVAGNPKLDKARRKLLANKYPKEVWYFIACFIFLVGIGNVGSRLLARRRQTAVPRDSEDRNGPARGAIAFRRLPLAVVNAYRILAFRCTVPIGNKYTLNVAELLITATYIIILFVWSLINSQLCFLPTPLY